MYLQNEDKPKELICTYNVNQQDEIDFNVYRIPFLYIVRKLQIHFIR